MRRDLRTYLVLAVLTAGCAGPQAHVSITGKQVSLDVAFGKPSAQILHGNNPPLSPVPGGLGVLPVSGSGGDRVIVRYVTDTPPPGTSLPPLPPPPACPQADPLAAPAVVAGDSVEAKAQSGTFPYRVSGRAITGRTVRTFTGTATHTVTSSSIGQGVYRYDIAVRMLGATTTYSYLVTPAFSALESLPGSIQLTKVTGTGGLDYVASFHPTKPIQLFTQPAYTGATWSDHGVDATTATVATVSGTVEGKDAVNACGTPLDSWKTTTVMTIVNPNEHVQATLTTWWATQYGGLPIAESETYTGTAGNQTIKGTFTSTINRVPGQDAG